MLAAFSVGRSACQRCWLLHCRNVSCRWYSITQQRDVSKMTLMEADMTTIYKGIQREPRPLEQQHHTLSLSFHGRSYRQHTRSPDAQDHFRLDEACLRRAEPRRQDGEEIW